MPDSPVSLDPLESAEGICYACPQGLCSLIEGVDLVKSAIAHCRDQGMPKLLFNATGLRGIPIPSLVDRFLMVEEWAQTAESMVVVGLVVRAEYIHPQKFGVVVAADFGLTCDVYTSERDALAWLTSAPVPPK